MAGSRPRRNRRATLRYGYDDLTNLSDDEPEQADDTQVDIDATIDDELSSSSASSSSSSSDSEESEFEDGWQVVAAPNDSHTDLPFTGPEGWQINQPESLAEYVGTFLEDALFEKLCQWTNSRATIAEATAFENGEEFRQWVPVSLPEMKKFIGLTLCMGIIRKNTLDSYWSTQLLEKTPYFSTCMARDRYRQLLKYLRFSNPYNANADDRSSRLHDLDAECLRLCLQFIPGRDLSLDESLLLHKGRLQFKICILTKRSRFGIKIFLLCDSEGYMICWQVYYGREAEWTCTEPGVEHLSKSELIVVYLFSKAHMLDKGYVVTLDNWYTSVRLANYLWSRRTAVRGTIRSNRGIPKALIDKRLNAMQSAYMRNGPVLAVKFSDRKMVYLVSTTDAARNIEKTRRLGAGRTVTYQRPLAIEAYNLKMGGVDLTDQLIASTNCVRKSHVWFKKLGFHFVQRLALNSYLRFKKEREPRMPFSQFLKRVIVCLTGVASEPQRVRFNRTADVDSTTQQMHMIEEIRGRKRRRCCLCKQAGRRKDSFFQCDT